MDYKILLVDERINLVLDIEDVSTLAEGIHRVNFYFRKRNDFTFIVVNKTTEEIEYTIPNNKENKNDK